MKCYNESNAVSHAGNNNNPWLEFFLGTLSRGFNQGHQELCQEEMAQMIGAKLHIKSILRFPIGANHHSGIIDQDVNLLLFLQQVICTFPYRPAIFIVKDASTID